MADDVMAGVYANLLSAADRSQVAASVNGRDPARSAASS
jgi:hypothetical protein